MFAKLLWCFYNNKYQDDIYSAIIYGICESSLLVLWAKVSQRQVAANS